MDAILVSVKEMSERYKSGDSMVTLSAGEIGEFRRIIYDYYKKYRRDFPWRRTDDPYHILVSEIMLQQTQTERVAIKFPEFILAFPTIQDLAAAEPAGVLAVWQGLGYNRRAVMLHRLAVEISENRDGVIPSTQKELAGLPGIGKATAASICAFAFDRPEIFIETNIRTVFLHFFFPDRNDVEDAVILPLVRQTLDLESPHHWYSALMDFGVMLKKNFPNPGRRSRHHRAQPPFNGSVRQVRGMIVKALLEDPGMTKTKMRERINVPPEMLQSALDGLAGEGMVRCRGRRYYL